MASGLVSGSIWIGDFFEISAYSFVVGHVYEMMGSSVKDPFVPHFTCARCCANFGQDSFLYEPANEAKSKCMALVCDWAKNLQLNGGEPEM